MFKRILIANRGEIARRVAAVAAAIDHVLGERKRQISGQMTGRPVTREGRLAVWLDRDEVLLDVARDGDTITIRFVGADGGVRRGRWRKRPVMTLIILPRAALFLALGVVVALCEREKIGPRPCR